MKIFLVASALLTVAWGQKYYDVEVRSPHSHTTSNHDEPKRPIHLQHADIEEMKSHAPIGSEHNPIHGRGESPHKSQRSTQNEPTYHNNQPHGHSSINRPVLQAIPAPHPLFEVLVPHGNGIDNGNGNANANGNGNELNGGSKHSSELQHQTQMNETEHTPTKTTHRYPLTPPSLRFRIGLVADLGKGSITKNGTFISYLHEGHLSVRKITKKRGHDGKEENSPSHNITVEFKIDAKVHRLESKLNNGGQGFLLSTLNVFHEKLYSCDSRTGIIYELFSDPDTGHMTPLPWVILSNTPKGTAFNCKWATVKDNHLWVGSVGIAFNKDELEESDTLYIRKISSHGHVTCIDWTENYEKIAKALDIDMENGFVNHEAVAWSDILQQWIFTPRRVSEKKIGNATIDKTGSNLGIFADELFEDIKIKEIGELVETHGFTSVKFIPGYDLVLALKSGADKKSGHIVSMLTVFDVEGKQLMEPTFAANGTFTGVEFL